MSGSSIAWGLVGGFATPATICYNGLMTPRSVAEACLALIWCATILFSMMGWGFLIARLCRIVRPGVGIAAALGIAFECAVGSVLNLLHLITGPVLLGLTAAGAAVLAWELVVQRRQRSGANNAGRKTTIGEILATVVIATLIVLHLFSFVRMARYDQCPAGDHCNRTAFTATADDTQAYLVMPLKMFQLHHFAADPYSQRRIMGSLGYNFYLQNIFLALGDLRNISVVDGGLGVLLLGALALGFAKTLNLTRAQTLVFVLLAAYTKQIYWNLSSVWLPCALFLALALMACRKDLLERPTLQALCLGALGGSAVALKNNYLVYVVLFIFIYYAFFTFSRALSSFPEKASRSQQASAFARSLFWSLCGALLVSGLWMFDQHRTSGTYFFPVLGHGFEYTTYHLLPTRSITTIGQLLKCILLSIPSFLAGAVGAIWAKKSLIKLVAIAAAVASGLATIATGLATGADMLRRYCFPQIMVVLLLLFPLMCFLLNERPKVYRHPRLILGAVGVVIMFAYVADIWNSNTGFASPPNTISEHTEDLFAGLRNAPFNTPEVIAEYKAVENTLPLHSVALEAVTYPYLFDNTRNTYYEASFPAMASPPPAPGWPIFADGHALGDWLISHHVRYLIYSYIDQPLEPRTAAAEITDQKTPAVVRATAIGLTKAHAQYEELARTKRHLFDDGSIYVLDLQSISP